MLNNKCFRVIEIEDAQMKLIFYYWFPENRSLDLSEDIELNRMIEDVYIARLSSWTQLCVVIRNIIRDFIYTYIPPAA